MPLPRPCEHCKKRFQPETTWNKICKKCFKEIKRLSVLKAKKKFKNRKRKVNI